MLLRRHGHFAYRFEKFRMLSIFQGIPEVSGISPDLSEKMISAIYLKVLAKLSYDIQWLCYNDHHLIFASLWHYCIYLNTLAHHLIQITLLFVQKMLLHIIMFGPCHIEFCLYLDVFNLLCPCAISPWVFIQSTSNLGKMILRYVRLSLWLFKEFPVVLPDLSRIFWITKCQSMFGQWCTCRVLMMCYFSLSFCPIDFKPLHNDHCVLLWCALTFLSHTSCYSGSQCGIMLVQWCTCLEKPMNLGQSIKGPIVRGTDRLAPCTFYQLKYRGLYPIMF